MSIDKILNLLKEKIEKSRLQKERVIIFWIDLEKTYSQRCRVYWELPTGPCPIVHPSTHNGRRD